MPFLARTAALIHKATRPIARKGWMHWLRFALLLLIGSFIGHILSESDRFNDWRYWLYQKQTRVLHRGPIYPKYPALVLLDDDDYWSEDFQARSPLKRESLAALLDRLNAAGVNTVAFDVFMDSPIPSKPNYEFLDYRNEDDLFFQSVRRMCDSGRRVVLATEFWIDEAAPHASDGRLAYTQPPSIYDSHLPDLPCVTQGHVLLPSDDFRTIPGTVTIANGKKLDSLALAVVRLSDPIAYENLSSDQDKGFRFGQFLTPEDFSTRNGHQFIFSGHEINQMDLNQLRRALADKVVIIGGHWHSAAYKTGNLVDMWDSPGGSESGSMLHANYVEAMRDPRSSFIGISERSAEIIEWCLAFLLALIGALEVHEGWKWTGFVLSFFAALLLSYVLLQNLGLFLDFFIPIVIIVAHTFVEELLEMRHQLHHAHAKLREHGLHDDHHRASSH